jgi:RNA polymerase sigma-70 factor (ECF subfamily)
VAESGQQSDAAGAVRSSAPSPRKKVSVSLTPAQAESLRALWQEHSAALHAMLTGWCGNAQNASDMLQELFRRLAESPSVLVRMKNTRAFLAVSARRIAVDFARRSATRTSYQTAAGAEVPVVENPGPTDENLRAAIKGALDELPAEQRVVFEHKILKGRTLEEIARLESISLNTAASRLRYALDKIRGQLRPYYDDLNRSSFKNMKNDLNQDLSENKRIITPLEPKRVPSVVPGLEGLAALAADDCQAPAPEIAIPEAEFVEALPLPELFVEALPFGEVRPIDAPSETQPEIFSCEVGGNAWEQFALPVAVEPIALDGEDLLAEETWDATTAGELPELVTCEIFPTEIAEEWLRPIYVGEIPEDFFVTVFEGEGGSDTGVNTGDEVADGEGAPFDFESGFEICVLPVPEEFAAEMDPREYLVRYDAFLSDNPDWNAPDPDFMETQVVTPSSYFSELEFGTPSKAAAFDSWYEANYAQSDADGGGLLGGSSFVLAPGNFPWGTVLSGGEVHSEGNPSFETTGVIMDVRNGLTGVPAEWMRGGASGGGGLMLNGGVPDPVAGGGSVSLNGVSDFQGTTVVTGETVYAYNPEVGADVSAQIELGELPTEITLAEASGVEVAPSFTNAVAGLAPTPGAALIVEFSVLSPSEAVQPATGSPIVADQSASQDVDNPPHEFSAATSHDAIEASAISTSNIDTSHDLPPQVAASGHESAAAAPSSQKVDAPTVAAGAVAAGTVVHGGAVAPSVRRPLPKV